MLSTAGKDGSEEMRGIYRETLESANNHLETLRAIFNDKMKRCFSISDAQKIALSERFDRKIDYLKDLNHSLSWWEDNEERIKAAIDLLHMLYLGGDMVSLLRDTGVAMQDLQGYATPLTEDLVKKRAKINEALIAWKAGESLYDAYLGGFEEPARTVAKDGGELHSDRVLMMATARLEFSATEESGNDLVEMVVSLTLSHEPDSLRDLNAFVNKQRSLLEWAMKEAEELKKAGCARPGA